MGLQRSTPHAPLEEALPIWTKAPYLLCVHEVGRQCSASEGRRLRPNGLAVLQPVPEAIKYHSIYVAYLARACRASFAQSDLIQEPCQSSQERSPRSASPFGLQERSWYLFALVLADHGSL